MRLHAADVAKLPERIQDYLGGSFSQVVRVSNCTENRFAMRANEARNRRPITNQVVSQLNRDYPLVLGTVAFFGVLIVVFNLASDILQALMDPKTRK